MTHYLVIHDWACSDIYDNGVDIIGIAHSLEEAKKLFNEKVLAEKEVAVENNWEIYDDNDCMFDAGEDGYYVSAHTKLYIQMVK